MRNPHKALMILVFVSCMIWLELPLRHPVQAQQPVLTPTPDVAVASAADTLLTAGSPTDTIPVIIRMQTKFVVSPLQSRLESRRIRSAYAIAQDEFVARQQDVLLQVSGRTTLIPMIFAVIERQHVATLRNDPAVVSIELDEPALPSMYETVDIINSRTANASGYDGTGTSVAILDTGVLKNHMFLDGQVVDEACFGASYDFGGYTAEPACPGGATSSYVTGSGEPCDLSISGCDHGTHVAGTVAGIPLATAYGQIRGVAPGAKLIAVQVFSIVRYTSGTNPCGSGTECVLSYSSNQIQAMQWLYDNRNTASWGTLAALNMSLGGGQYTTACDSQSRKAYIDMLRAVGIATVIASGNNGYTSAISAPACISSAISVGATEAAKYGLTLDKVAYFSNAPTIANNAANADGDYLLDVLAPGYWVLSANAGDSSDFSFKAGTSMATPHVAGAWAVLKQAFPYASVSQLLALLHENGTTVTDYRNSLVLPRIDVMAAINAGAWLQQTATVIVAATATQAAISTQTAATVATQAAVATQTAAATATQAAALTQTAVAAATATQAAKLTATANAVATATAVVAATQTAVAEITQTAAVVATTTRAAQLTGTAVAATGVAEITQTAAIAATTTRAAQLTGTVVVRTATAAAQSTAKAAVVQTKAAAVQTAAVVKQQTANALATTKAGVAQTKAVVAQTVAAAKAQTATVMAVSKAQTAAPALTAKVAVAQTKAAVAQTVAAAKAQTATAVAVSKAQTAAPVLTAKAAVAQTKVTLATNTAAARQTAVAATKTTLSAQQAQRVLTSTAGVRSNSDIADVQMTATMQTRWLQATGTIRREASVVGIPQVPAYIQWLSNR